MGLRKWFDRMQQKKALAAQYGIDMEAQQLAQKKMMSPEEYQYRKLLAKQRNDYYKKVLQAHKEQMKHELWHKDVVSQKYIFKDKGEVLRG